MGLKLSEAEFEKMINSNSKLKIASVIGKGQSAKVDIEDKNTTSKIKIDKQSKKKNKISLLEPNELEEEEKSDKARSKGVKVSEINKLNKSSICSSSVSDEHLSFLFSGAKLLSVNQIFAILQYRKYEIFSYKKVWHEIIRKNLEAQFYLLKSEKKKLPYFDSSVEITLFRQASRLVDEDAMSTMFKYIIDGLKRDPNKNPYGTLAEDNPKIVHRIVCYSEKGEPAIGIKVKKIEEKKKEFSAKDILIK